MYEDFGTFNKNRCDYPDYAFLVAHAVATKKM
jgi:ribose 5-phosphate isomerase RpiB